MEAVEINIPQVGPIVDTSVLPKPITKPTPKRITLAIDEYTFSVQKTLDTKIIQDGTNISKLADAHRLEADFDADEMLSPSETSQAATSKEVVEFESKDVVEFDQSKEHHVYELYTKLKTSTAAMKKQRFMLTPAEILDIIRVAYVSVPTKLFESIDPELNTVSRITCMEADYLVNVYNCYKPDSGTSLLLKKIDDLIRFIEKSFGEFDALPASLTKPKKEGARRRGVKVADSYTIDVLKQSPSEMTDDDVKRMADVVLHYNKTLESEKSVKNSAERMLIRSLFDECLTDFFNHYETDDYAYNMDEILFTDSSRMYILYPILHIWRATCVRLIDSAQKIVTDPENAKVLKFVPNEVLHESEIQYPLDDDIETVYEKRAARIEDARMRLFDDWNMREIADDILQHGVQSGVGVASIQRRYQIVLDAYNVTNTDLRADYAQKAATLAPAAKIYKDSFVPIILDIISFYNLLKDVAKVLTVVDNLKSKYLARAYGNYQQLRQGKFGRSLLMTYGSCFTITAPQTRGMDEEEGESVDESGSESEEGEAVDQPVATGQEQYKLTTTTQFKEVLEKFTTIHTLLMPLTFVDNEDAVVIRWLLQGADTIDKEMSSAIDKLKSAIFVPGGMIYQLINAADGEWTKSLEQVAEVALQVKFANPRLAACDKSALLLTQPHSEEGDQMALVLESLMRIFRDCEYFVGYPSKRDMPTRDTQLLSGHSTIATYAPRLLHLKWSATLLARIEAGELISSNDTFDALTKEEKELATKVADAVQPILEDAYMLLGIPSDIRAKHRFTPQMAACLMDMYVIRQQETNPVIGAAAMARMERSKLCYDGYMQSKLAFQSEPANSTYQSDQGQTEPSKKQIKYAGLVLAPRKGPIRVTAVDAVRFWYLHCRRRQLYEVGKKLAAIRAGEISRKVYPNEPIVTNIAKLAGQFELLYKKDWKKYAAHQLGMGEPLTDKMINNYMTSTDIVDRNKFNLINVYHEHYVLLSLRLRYETPLSTEDFLKSKPTLGGITEKYEKTPIKSSRPSKRKRVGAAAEVSTPSSKVLRQPLVQKPPPIPTASSTDSPLYIPNTPPPLVDGNTGKQMPSIKQVVRRCYSNAKQLFWSDEGMEAMNRFDHINEIVSWAKPLVKSWKTTEDAIVEFCLDDNITDTNHLYMLFADLFDAIEVRHFVWSSSKSHTFMEQPSELPLFPTVHNVTKVTFDGLKLSELMAESLGVLTAAMPDLEEIVVRDCEFSLSAPRTLAPFPKLHTLKMRNNRYAHRVLKELASDSCTPPLTTLSVEMGAALIRNALDREDVGAAIKDLLVKYGSSLTHLCIDIEKLATAAYIGTSASNIENLVTLEMRECISVNAMNLLNGNKGLLELRIATAAVDLDNNGGWKPPPSVMRLTMHAPPQLTSVGGALTTLDIHDLRTNKLPTTLKTLAIRKSPTMSGTLAALLANVAQVDRLLLQDVKFVGEKTHQYAESCLNNRKWEMLSIQQTMPTLSTISFGTDSTVKYGARCLQLLYMSVQGAPAPIIPFTLDGVEVLSINTAMYKPGLGAINTLTKLDIRRPLDDAMNTVFSDIHNRTAGLQYLSVVVGSTVKDELIQHLKPDQRKNISLLNVSGIPKFSGIQEKRSEYWNTAEKLQPLLGDDPNSQLVFDTKYAMPEHVLTEFDI